MTVFLTYRPMSGEYNHSDPVAQYIVGSPAEGYWTAAEDLPSSSSFKNHACPSFLPQCIPITRQYIIVVSFSFFSKDFFYFYIFLKKDYFRPLSSIQLKNPDTQLVMDQSF